MIKTGKIFSFSAAHTLPHHEGQCANLHGHNYKLEVQVKGLVQIFGSEQGMVMDFKKLGVIVEDAVLFLHDHRDLNKIYTNPTAEVMVKTFAQDIQNSLPSGVEVVLLRLWETEKCYAEWTND